MLAFIGLGLFARGFLERWGWAVFNGLCHEGCKNTRPEVLQFRSILIPGDRAKQMRPRHVGESRCEEEKMTSSIPTDIDARLLKERERPIDQTRASSAI